MKLFVVMITYLYNTGAHTCLKENNAKKNIKTRPKDPKIFNHSEFYNL